MALQSTSVLALVPPSVARMNVGPNISWNSQRSMCQSARASPQACTKEQRWIMGVPLGEKRGHLVVLHQVGYENILTTIAATRTQVPMSSVRLSHSWDGTIEPSRCA
jgi:hypothetical protein